MEQKIEQLFVAFKAIIVHDGKILLLQESSRYEDGTNAGKWDVPGGRMGLGEDWQDALRREVKEETGMDVSIGKPLDVGEWRPVIKGIRSQVIAVFMECRSKADAVALSQDHAAYVWLHPAAILERTDCVHGIQDVIKKYSTACNSAH